MNMKKSLLSSILVLGTLIGATAASAAPYSVTGTDTMWTIAKQHGISLSSLVQANPQVTNADNIWPGLILNLPDTGTGSSVQQETGDSAATSTFASQVVMMVNQERVKAGLHVLVSDSSLSAMALDKAKDMYNNQYFDHTSPTYGSPFDMMSTYGIRYTYAGENIAMGQRTPQEVMTAWMNSAGHRQNIMSPNFTKIGVSYYNGEWVQEFIAD
ncbi:CAP domain-containing protein [Paenibacillus agricola]